MSVVVSTSSTVSLTRAQRDAVLKYVEWGVELEVWNRLQMVEIDCEEMRRMARWLTAASRMREMLWWEDPPDRDMDAFELEVDEDIVWLVLECLEPHVQENLDGGDEESYAERYPLMPPKDAELLDSLVAAHHQRDLDALAAAQLIGGAA